MSKRKTQVVIRDGQKITLCAYRKPRKSEKTFDIDKSRYTAWATGVTKFEHGTRGVQGTVEKGE